MAHVHKKAYVWIIGLVIFGFILIKINIPDIFVMFSRIRVFYIALALFLRLDLSTGPGTGIEDQLYSGPFPGRTGEPGDAVAHIHFWPKYA